MTSTEGRQDWAGTTGPAVATRQMHRAWLLDQARRLFAFFQPAALNPAGGFFALDDQGAPLPPPGPRGQVRSLHEATRMVHCFAMAHQLGLPGPTAWWITEWPSSGTGTATPPTAAISGGSTMSVR